MGRILEVLGQVELSPSFPADPGPRFQAAAPEVAPVGEELPVEAMPFIEVGGPRKIFDASPDVLACPSPPGLRVGSPVAPPSRPENRARSVTFRPFLPGTLPLPPAQQRFAPELVAFHHPEDPLGEGYRALLSTIRTQALNGRSQAVLFSALSSGTGTTTVLLNLAITAARQGLAPIVTVDANGRRPAIAQRLGLPVSPGLREVLAGTHSVQEVLRETGLPNLLTLTAGKPDDDGTVRLVIEALPVVLRQLRERCGLVLVDGSAWDMGPEVGVLANACDAAYLVVAQAQAESPSVAASMQSLRERGVPLRGCILTQG